jgi:hypothetical protein
MRRGDLSKITLIVACTYLIYSAYYVSVNMPSIKSFLELIINMLYIYLFAQAFSNTRKTKNFIKGQIIVSQTSNMPQIIPALQLKLNIVNRYNLVMCTYFWYELLINGLLPTVKLIFRG